MLATELAYASETLGWSRDWSADTGFPDRETIYLLRNIQEKVAGIVHGSETSARSSGQYEDPAWVPISMDRDDEYWAPFDRKFQFRPKYAPAQLAITEPTPSVTLDLNPIFAAGHGEFAAGENAINALALLTFVRAFDQDTSLVVLDWQHQSYRLWPHRLARQPDPRWETEVFRMGTTTSS